MFSPSRAASLSLKEPRIYQEIRNFPAQFFASWKIVRDHPKLTPWAPTPGATVYYAAMGGSSLPADLVNDGLGAGPRLEIVRDYRLPAAAGPQDLCIASSYSGNTEETLAALDDALARGCRAIALSHGGQLEAKAKAAGIPHVPIPESIQPRCASGYFFASLVGIFHRLSLIPTPEGLLDRLSKHLSGVQDACEARGKALAEALRDRVPIVYGPAEFAGAARIWKIKFNENAKIQSFSNVFPELNHNEMVGFTRLLMKPVLIFLESRFMHPRVKRRMDVMEEILGREIPIRRLACGGESPLFEMFEGLAVADYASYHLAQAYGIDPAPVEMVEAFKKKL